MKEPLSGEPTRDEDTVPQAAQPEGLTEMLRDQAERWGRGECVRAEFYLERLPTLVGDADGLLDLVCHEILLRVQRGESPTLEEYQRRFPYLKDQLQSHFV